MIFERYLGIRKIDEKMTKKKKKLDKDLVMSSLED